MKKLRELIIMGLILMGLFYLFGCTKENEVNLKVINTFTEDMYVNEDGTVGHCIRHVDDITVKKGDYAVDGVAKIVSVGTDYVKVKLDNGYIAYSSDKPGKTFKIKKGESFEFLMYGLCDATDKYTIYYE